MIAIINYDMGNLQSVSNMLNFLGAEHVVTRDPSLVASADKIILPGVGAFNEAMKNLRNFGLVDLLRDEVLEKKKPFLGICLGMQLIGSRGFEGGETEGLAFVAGDVVRMKPANPELRVPHMGWDDVTPKVGTAMYKDTRSRVFYFVHSYHIVPTDPSVISGACDYGGALVASLEKGNIWATQFHPEKSQKDGIELLKNFLAC